MKTFQFSKIKIAIFLFFVATSATWITFEHWSSAAKDVEPSTNINQNISQSLVPQSSGLPSIKASAQPMPALTISDSRTTYRLQQPRPAKRYNGPIGVDNVISGHTLGWWLYASSEAEVRWLDYYGYPTPAEEARLTNSSDIELASLVDQGDLNAKAHQITRLTMKAFTDGDMKLMAQAVGRAKQLLTEGGPYQAFAVSAAYGDMLRVYAALPDTERTAEKQSALNRFDVIANYAHGIGIMYSDISFTRLWNTRLQGERERLGLSELKVASSMQLASGLGGRTAARNSLGLATVLLPRPEPPDLPNNSPAAVILERY